MILSGRNYLVYARLTLPTPRRSGRGPVGNSRSLSKSEAEHQAEY